MPVKVSVCIPTYNQAAYLALAVESALKQTLPPFEIIVSNDASTDDTKTILDQLEKKIPILKVIHQPVNVGISKNTNDCLRAASGQYIVRLDSDDMLEPGYIESLSKLLERFDTAGYAHAAVTEIDQNGERLKERKLLRSEGFQSSDEALQAAIKGYRVAANILMFRKKTLEEVGYISCSENFAEDYFLSVKIAAAGYGNVYSEKVLSKYRVWTDAGKVRQKRKLSEIYGLKSVFDDALRSAYIEKGWKLNPLDKAKENFAIAQACCLGWEVYTPQEKSILEEALLSFSNTKKTRQYISIYKNGFGAMVDWYNHQKRKLKILAKSVILSVRKNGA